MLVLALVIGAWTGAVVVAFILLTERLGMRLYLVGSVAWRRVLIVPDILNAHQKST